MTDTATSEDAARAFLQAAGIETGTGEETRAAYREHVAAATDGLPIAPRVPLRLTAGPPADSVTVDAWQAKGTRPTLDELATVEAVARLAGWDVVRLTPDALRLDPPHVAARLAEQDRARRRAWLTARAEELRTELAAVTLEMASLDG